MAESILIINTDKLALRKLRELLSREGFDVITASDIKTAREIKSKIQISLILASSSLIDLAKP